MAAADISSITDSVVSDNLKSIAGASAFYATQAMGNLIAHQNRMNVLAEALVSRAARSIVEDDPMEAASASKILSGNDLAATLAQLLAAINSGQQGVKSAGNTPPVTP